ncbi:Uncharacterised protein [Mycobacterium tuberculosis]|nr:Uncharacterised protein [Mycobacterium tuberculosis]
MAVDPAAGTARPAGAGVTALGAVGPADAAAAGTARPAGAGVTALGAAGPGAGTVAALSAVTADAADTAVAEQSGRSPGPAGTTRDARRADGSGGAGAAGAAIAAAAVEPAAVAARAAVGAGSAGPSVAAVADQPGRPAGTPGEPGGGLGKPVAAVAIQQPTGATVGIGRGPIGAVADQRTPPQRLGGRVDQTQHLLLDIGRLGAGIRARRPGQCLHELLVKQRCTRAQLLILAGVGGKQCRDRRGHLIGTGRGQHRRRGQGGRVGRADCRTDTGHIGRRGHQLRRRHQHKRHGFLSLIC